MFFYNYNCTLWIFDWPKHCPDALMVIVWPDKHEIVCGLENVFIYPSWTFVYPMDG